MMSVERWSIAGLSLMLFAVTLMQGALVPLTQGFRWGLGSRDEPIETTALQGRFARTVQNQIEAMLIYIPLMALVLVLERESGTTAIAAWLMIGARLAFIACYLGGVFGLRSFAYGISLIAIFMTIWALLP